MIINRQWAMPNKNTFQIKPIKDLIERYINQQNKDSIILNPFQTNHCGLSHLEPV